MFYAGQPVFVQPEKKVGIFLSMERRTSTVGFDKAPLYRVAFLDDDDELAIEGFLLTEIYFLHRPDDKSLTGTSIYYGPVSKEGKYILRKKTWACKITEDEYKKRLPEYLKLINTITKAPWFIENYITTEYTNSNKEYLAGTTKTSSYNTSCDVI